MGAILALSLPPAGSDADRAAQDDRVQDLVEERSAVGMLTAASPIIVESVDGHGGGDGEGSGDEAAIIASLRKPRPLTGGTSSIIGPSALAVNRGLSVNFPNPTPNDVQAAVVAGVNAWDNVLKPVEGAPIVVQVVWESFNNSSMLGAAGPETMWYEPAGTTNRNLPKADVLYPTALVNVLSGSDANGSSRPEILVSLNKDRYAAGGWYTGTGVPPAGKIDLRSVVVHEVGHGLGFLGSPQSGQPRLGDPVFAYDTQIKFGASLITNLANESTALTSGRLKGHVSQSLTAGIYAPSTWRQGSSLSHIDPAGGQTAALMVPSLATQQIKRQPDGWALGVLSEMGWPTDVSPLKPTITSHSATVSTISVNWSYPLTKTGLPPDTVTVKASRNGTVAAKATIAASNRSHTFGGLNPGTGYTITITPNAEGRQGSAAMMTRSTSTAASFPNFIRACPLDHQIVRVFQAFFLRDPAEAGFDAWLDRRANKLPLLSIYDQFAKSSEFTSRYGSLSNGGFVNLVYRNVLGRSADTTGYQTWVRNLNGGMSRAEMMMRFAESTEHINRTGTVAPHPSTEGKIRRLYKAVFLRDADASGLNIWTSRANGGMTLAQIAERFVASTEFQQRYGNLTNRQFVSLVYRNVLNRPPDTTGYNTWVNQLNAGMSRGTMMIGFSESQEFIKRTCTIP